MGDAMESNCSSLIHPFLQAISYRHEIFKPCLFSITSTNVEASDKDSWVSVSSQANTIITNEFFTDDKNLRQNIGTRLFSILEIDAIITSVT